MRIGFTATLIALSWYIVLTTLGVFIDIRNTNDAQVAEQHWVRVTYYTWTGNPMASGIYPYVGAAACDYSFSMGTKIFFEDGFEVTCLDRGHLGYGHVDIYADSHEMGQRIADKYGYWESVEVFN